MGKFDLNEWLEYCENPSGEPVPISRDSNTTAVLSSCHPFHGVEVFIDRNSGHLYITCEECKKSVAAFKLARKPMMAVT